MEDRRKKRVSLKAKPTTLWKEKLRENCLNRVRQERSQLLWKIRSSCSASGTDQELALGDIVSEEILRFKASPASKKLWNDDHDALPEDQDVDMLWHYQPRSNAVLVGAEYEDLMVAMEQALHEDVLAELKTKEAALLEEYEVAEAWQDEAFDALLKGSLAEVSQENGVLCPICKRGFLHQEKKVIFCCCGFRLDTQDEQIGLDFLRGRLADVWRQHANSNCQGFPLFLMEHVFGISALYMHCRTCNQFDLVV